MVPWVGPISLDPSRTEERNGDLPIGRPRKPSVEGSQDEAESPAAGLGREMAGQQPPGGAEIIETGERLQTSGDLTPIEDGIRQQVHGA